MATYYVWSGATGTANGSSWANAFTTIAAFLAVDAAGDNVFLAHDHNESTATSVTWTHVGAVANPIKFQCVNRFGSVPPVALDRRTTAAVTTTANSSLTINGASHWDGVVFNIGVGATTVAANLILGGATSDWQRFDNCSMRLAQLGTGASYIQIGTSASSSLVEFNNTTVSFASVTQTIYSLGRFRWRNTLTALIGAVQPTVLFTPTSARGGYVECIGVDLSASGLNKFIVGGLNSQGTTYQFIDCKISAAATKSAQPSAHGSTEPEFLRCGDAAGSHFVHRQRISGTLVEEGRIARVGGSYDGVKAISWKIAPSGTCTFSMPFETQPIAIWNDVVDEIVYATVEGLASTGALPKNDECWLEVEYLNDASSPLAAFATNGKPNLLADAASQPASAAIWQGIAVGLRGADEPPTAETRVLPYPTLDGVSSGPIILSNGKLTVQHNSTTGGQGVFSSSSMQGGKIYFEIRCDSGTTGSILTSAMGVVLSGKTSFSIADFQQFGTTINLGSGSQIQSNGASTSVDIGPCFAGRVARFALDFGGRLAWICFDAEPWNDDITANPATGVGGVIIAPGIYHPGVRFNGSTALATDQFTFNFGATPFSYAVPFGYEAGFIGWKPFKMETSFTPKQEGFIFARVKSAQPGTYVYIDPLVKFGPPDTTPPAAVWATTFALALDIDSGAWSDKNMRQWFDHTLLAESGTKFRLTLQSGSAAEGAQISGMYAGHAAADGMDFDGTQVQVKVSGASSFTIPPNSTIVTDHIDYPFDSAKNFLVAAHFDNAAHDTVRGRDGFAGTTLYTLAGSNESSVANVSGYTNTANTIRLVTKIEVWQP